MAIKVGGTIVIGDGRNLCNIIDANATTVTATTICATSFIGSGAGLVNVPGSSIIVCSAPITENTAATINLACGNYFKLRLNNTLAITCFTNNTCQPKFFVDVVSNSSNATISFPTNCVYTPSKLECCTINARKVYEFVGVGEGSSRCYYVRGFTSSEFDILQNFPGTTGCKYTFNVTGSCSRQCPCQACCNYCIPGVAQIQIGGGDFGAIKGFCATQAIFCCATMPYTCDAVCGIIARGGDAPQYYRNRSIGMQYCGDYYTIATPRLNFSYCEGNCSYGLLAAKHDIRNICCCNGFVCLISAYCIGNCDARIISHSRVCDFIVIGRSYCDCLCVNVYKLSCLLDPGVGSLCSLQNFIIPSCGDYSWTERSGFTQYHDMDTSSNPAGLWKFTRCYGPGSGSACCTWLNIQKHKMWRGTSAVCPVCYTSSCCHNLTCRCTEGNGIMSPCVFSDISGEYLWLIGQQDSCCNWVSEVLVRDPLYACCSNTCFTKTTDCCWRNIGNHYENSYKFSYFADECLCHRFIFNCGGNCQNDGVCCFNRALQGGWTRIGDTVVNSLPEKCGVTCIVGSLYTNTDTCSAVFKIDATAGCVHSYYMCCCTCKWGLTYNSAQNTWWYGNVAFSLANANVYGNMVTFSYGNFNFVNSLGQNIDPLGPKVLTDAELCSA